MYDYIPVINTADLATLNNNYRNFEQPAKPGSTQRGVAEKTEVIVVEEVKPSFLKKHKKALMVAGAILAGIYVVKTIKK